MKTPANLEMIFPIQDASSASFMSFKANCLLDAGIEGAIRKIDRVAADLREQSAISV